MPTASSNVLVRLEIGENLPHVCQSMRDTPETTTAVARIGEFLHNHL